MLHSRYFKSLLFVVFVSLLNQVSAQSVEEIISKHIKAMGGADKLSKFKSLKMISTMSVMNISMPVSTTVIQDRAFRTETTVENMKIIQAVNGSKGWMLNPMAGENKAIALPDEAVQQYSAQTDLTGLYNYKEKGYTVNLEGEQDLSGAKVYKLVLTMKNGLKQENYISKDTYYILKVVATVPVNGQQVQTENLQSDFRQIDGITFPFLSEISTSAMPGTKMINKLETVEINPKIDESIFVMPN